MLKTQIEAEAVAFANRIADIIREDVINGIMDRLGTVVPTKKKAKSKRHLNAKSKTASKTASKTGRKSKIDKLTNAQKKVYDLLKDANKPMPTKEIAKSIGVSGSTMLYHLKRMETAKVIKRMRDGTTVYFQLR